MSRHISVIIPARLAHKFIDDCLHSVLTQHVPSAWKMSVFVGVDGCPDTLKAIKDGGHNIRCFFSSENVGAYVMRNYLITKSDADAFAFFDADDIMLAGYISETINAIERGNDFVMAPKYQCDAIMNRRRVVFQEGGAMTFTRDIIDKIGYFQPYKCAGDSDYMVRAKNRTEIKRLDRPLYLRRLHEASITRTAETGYKSEYRARVWAEMTRLRELTDYCDFDPEKYDIREV